MPAYVIYIREKTTDPRELAAYVPLSIASREGHEATIPVRYGQFEVMEGPQIEGAVVLKFATMDDAKAWYNSPKYQEALRHRLAGAEGRLFIIEGVE